MPFFCSAMKGASALTASFLGAGGGGRQAPNNATSAPSLSAAVLCESFDRGRQLGALLHLSAGDLHSAANPPHPTTLNSVARS